jgi:translation initiation factor IF-1
MKSAKNVEKLIKNAAIHSNAEVNQAVLRDLLTELPEAKEQTPALAKPNIGRTIMKSRIIKLAAAAMIVVAVLFTMNLRDRLIPSASAAQLLQDAVNAVSNVLSVYMKARMRTLPGDNFSNIGLNYDFVDIEMWKRTNTNGQVQWRVEKTGRVLLMDGQKTIMFIRPNYGVLDKRSLPPGCYDSWSGRLLNVQDLLDNELQNAKNNPNREVCLRHDEVEGTDKIVLEVNVTTDVPENDYLRNKFIHESDHVKVYQFDTKTKLLEALQVYVHTADEDVLIFEVTDIEYNIDIDDSVFVLDFPEDMIWKREPEILPDNERYEKMTPKEAAETFFQACAEENWEEVLKFWTASRIDERFKAHLGGLEIISIGEPFQSKGYNRKGWLVPYEIRLKHGDIKKHNLAIRKDNDANRFVVDGGI